MSRRFFFQSNPIDRPPNPGDSVSLDSNESHHLIHVMRSKIGDPLELFDGSGNQYACEITEINRREVAVRILKRNQVCRELNSKLIIAIPFPKADRQKFLVEKLTELGVSKVIFVNAARSGNQGNQKTIAKLDRIVIEASKQCGRNVLMQLSGPMNLDELAQAAPEKTESQVHRFFAHIDSDAQDAGSIQLEPNKDQTSYVLVGPEGGFDSSEIQMLLENGWHPLNLGKTILRMETAALAATALLRS